MYMYNGRSIYIVRHGERIDSINKNWYGENDEKHDPYLSEQGVVQAQLVGKRLAYEQIHAIFASPFLRTLQTAHFIAQQKNMDYFVETGIAEWHARGMMSHAPNLIPPAQRAKDFPYLNLHHKSFTEPVWPETSPQVRERYQKTVNYLLSRYPGNLLLVGHGKVVTGVASVMTGLPENQIQYNLAGLTQLTFLDGQWQLTRNSETQHLVTYPQIV